MTKITLSLALLATASVAFGQAPKQSLISGKAPKALNGKHIYLYTSPTSRDEKPLKLDSALVKKGTFTFAPQKVDSVSTFYLRTTDEPAISESLTLEAGRIVLNLDRAAEDTKIFVEGKLNLVNLAFRAENKELLKTAQAQINALDTTATDYKQKVESIVIKYGSDMRQKYQEVFAQHTNNAIGLSALQGLLTDTELTKEMFDSYKSRAGAELLAHPRLAKMLTSITNRFNVVEKTKFVDFSATTATGQAVKFSQYVGQGHYTLVDFWASWCGPCRRSMPELIKLNEQYGPKGLQILGLFVWDKPENLEPAVKALGLTWTQLISDQEATTTYGVQGIPHMMLIAPDGTIVARGIHGYDQISALLEQELSKNGGTL